MNLKIMKHTLLVICAMLVLGASAQQEKADYSAEKKEEIKQAIEAYPDLQENLQEVMSRFSPVDSLLKAEYIASVDSVVVITMLKKKQPYVYQENGITHIKEMYDEVRTKKPGQATQQGFIIWMNNISKKETNN